MIENGLMGLAIGIVYLVIGWTVYIVNYEAIVNNTETPSDEMCLQFITILLWPLIVVLAFIVSVYMFVCGGR